MGEALAEAKLAVARGERPIAAVAVVRDAMVAARSRPRRARPTTPPPTRSIVALREAARKLGRAELRDVTIFATLEPCAMCVGALLESDCEALVYALPEHARGRGRHRHPARPARRAATQAQGHQRHPPRRGRGPVRGRRRSRRRPAGARRRGEGRPGLTRPLWYPLPRRGVRVVDGAALEKRCAKAPRVRIPPSPPSAAGSPVVRPRRGRLVA